MKIRYGFVTNSSSSSFLIAKKVLTPNQVKAIWKHIELGHKLGISVDDDSRWDIEESENFIAGTTYMDNFSFDKFFELIGIKDVYVIWGANISADDAEEKLKSSNDNPDFGIQTGWEDLLDEI